MGDVRKGALLDIRDLRVRFGAVEAVRGVSLGVDEGEVLGLVGESGSGKSAMALAIMGLLPPTAEVAGKMLWRRAAGGTEVDLLRQTPEQMRQIRGREIAIIFQEPMTALNPVMTEGRQVAECAEAHAMRLTGWRRYQFQMRPSDTETIRTSSRAGSGSAF
jgi:ABC-type glutathione transport system ATPase component